MFTNIGRNIVPNNVVQLKAVFDAQGHFADSALKTELFSLFLTNEPDKSALLGFSHVEVGDHSLIYAARKQRSPKSLPRVINARQYKSLVLENFLCDIELAPWAMIEQFHYPIKIWES